MNVTYPTPINSTHFQVESATVRREVNLFVVSPEEIQLKRYIQYYNSNELESNGFWYSVVWCLLFGPLIWAFLIVSWIEKHDGKSSRNLTEPTDYSMKARKGLREQSTKRCPKCGASYSSQLDRCPYCRQE
jgi:hypothetical protein